MRVALLLLPIVAAGCTSGGFSFGTADSAVYVGVVTGTVYSSDGTRATSASVYLAENADGVPTEYGGSLANSEGHFQIEAVEGTYTLVAHQPGAAAYVEGVKIVGGVTKDIGEVHMAPCPDPTNPCPDPAPTPAPPPSFVLPQFEPDYTEVARHYYPSSSYDELYVRAESFTQHMELNFSFVEPSLYQPGTFGLATSGVLAYLTYVPENEPFANAYVAVGGVLVIDVWNLQQGGEVKLRVLDAQYYWYDQYTDTLDSGSSATIQTSLPMQGNVTLYSR